MGVDTFSGRGFKKYGGELFDGVNFIGAHFGDLDSVRLLEKANDFRSGLDGHISWSCIWHDHFLGKEFEGIGDSFGFCLVDKHAVTSVVVQRWPQTPSLSAMRIPRDLLGGFIVEDDFGAWWCQGCLIEVKDPF